jgi:hypothetical protein
MTQSARRKTPPSSDIAVCETEHAQVCHQRLFALDNASYRRAGARITEQLASMPLDHAVRLHIAGGWEMIAALAAWSSSRPEQHEVFEVLRRCGVTDEELAPFRGADINDLLPWLYYAKRFDVLRRVCGTAKAKTEAKLGRKHLLVHCHLVSDDGIVASSL